MDYDDIQQNTRISLWSKNGRIKCGYEKDFLLHMYLLLRKIKNF